MSARDCPCLQPASPLPRGVTPGPRPQLFFYCDDSQCGSGLTLWLITCQTLVQQESLMYGRVVQHARRKCHAQK